MDSAPVKIMVVDDDITTLKQLKLLLNKKDWSVDLIESGFEALKALEMDPGYDMVLLDVSMEGMNGIECAREIKKRESLKDIPIIFVTGMNYIEDKQRGFKAGCVDYITKPFDNSDAIMRINLHLELAYRRKEALNNNRQLQDTINARTFKINQTRKALIISLSSLAEFRDPETGAHILRTREFTKELAIELSKKSKFSGIVDETFIDLIYDCTPLHDIGKVGIPDHILLKPDKLTPDEMKIMQTHTIIGRDALMAGNNYLQNDDFINFCASIAYSHHERYDGRGYPLRLEGDQIPLQGRIMAIADVYDALKTKRSYKEGWSENEVTDYISSQRGKHFDPDLVDCFIRLKDKFMEISDIYRDKEKESST